MKTIKGPIAPLKTGNVIYQITLASGMIITSPAGFGLEELTSALIPAIIGENGCVFAKERQRDDESDRAGHRIDGQTPRA